MALIDKEIIRKEIEFAKSVYSNPKRVVHGVADAFRQDGRAAMCDDILKFLDTIPEQPVLPGIEEEGIPGKDFIPVEWVDACERYGKWKIVRVEQPVTDHHEIEVEFRGEKVTVNREFCRKEDKNYSTSEQDDNVIWAALRAWCEKKGITAFELYPEQPEQPVEGLKDDKIIDYAHSKFYYDKDFDGYGHSKFRPVFTREDLISFARHFAEWQKSQMLIKSSKKEVDEFMSRCDRDVLDELNRWRFTTACQEFIDQGIFDYGCAKHFAEWGAEQKSIEIFRKQNCQGCGTQRCTGDGEWLEGCKAFQAWKAEHLKK